MKKTTPNLLKSKMRKKRKKMKTLMISKMKTMMKTMMKKMTLLTKMTLMKTSPLPGADTNLKILRKPDKISVDKWDFTSFHIKTREQL